MTLTYYSRSLRPALWLSALLCALTLTSLPEAVRAQTFAQAHQTRTGHADARLTSLLEEDATSPALRRTIRLGFDGVPFEQALQTIAHRGDFGVSYNPNLIPQRQISMARAEGSVEEALHLLLARTDLDALISPQREIIIVPRTASAPPRETPQVGALPLYADLTLQKVEPRGTIRLQRQLQIITGQVTDAQEGTPLPGVNVVVQGTTVGTATDGNGEYELDVPENADVLVFSAVGYVTREIPIQGRTTINVQLQPDVEALDEVVVVGYGTQQRAEVTGAVSSVSSQDVQDLAVESFETAIQGKLAGVEVRQSTGEPGASPSIRVRGTGSISAGNDPLFVIDGLPITRDEATQGTLFRRRSTFTPPSLNPLATINTSDIESIEVLKDASAAAIYGSRGSNGVVLVTTKKGSRDGSPVVRYSGYYGMQEVTNTPDMMSSREVVDFTIDARNNNYIQEYDPLNPSSPNYNPDFENNPRNNTGRPDDGLVRIPDKYIEYDQNERTTNTDWLDLIFEPAPMFSSNLSVSGGSENIGYYVSGGIFQQDGTINRSDFGRYSLRVNVEADPLSRLRVGANVSTSLTQQDRLPASAPYFARPPGIVYSAMVHSPVLEPFNSDGSPNQLNGQSYLGGGTTSASHPIAIRNAVTEDLDHHRTFGTAYAEFDLGYDLALRTQFGADLSDYTRSFYRANTLLYRTASEGEPYAQSGSARSFSWLSENTLTYDRDYGDHSINSVLGFTAQKERNDLNSIIAQNFPDDEVPTVNGGQVTDGTSTAEEWSLLSYLARVNYSYQQKYLVTATLRADRSSRFGENNQTGVFPSASVGWRLSDEPFLQNVSSLSDLKVRASYGVTGNFLIPNYGSFGLLDSEDYVGGTGQNVISGVAPRSIGNDDLTWETTRELNIGLDAGFFNNRVTLAADYYSSTTSDLLLNVSLPSATGFETFLTNIGEVENQGLEFVLSTENLIGEFSWSTDLNFSTNRNEVTELGPEGAPILSSGAAGPRHITRIGDEIGSYYGYVVEGVYRDQADLDSAVPDREAPDPRPGDFKFKDVNGDGEITPADRTVTGSYFPDFTYGITNRFQYRGFDLNIFLQGVEGREILNLTSRHMKNGEANFNSYAIFTERWRSPEEPGNGEIPRADRQTGLHGNNNRPSSFQVEDGSYLRLRNVTLGYSFPITFLGSETRRARIYLAGQNLFTITDYLGFNPEVNLQSTPLTPGEDYGAYPLSRVYTLGVDFTF
jgi:TonB-linked SusC/RagA family outer membrane protein